MQHPTDCSPSLHSDPTQFLSDDGPEVLIEPGRVLIVPRTTQEFVALLANPLLISLLARTEIALMGETAPELVAVREAISPVVQALAQGHASVGAVRH